RPARHGTAHGIRPPVHPAVPARRDQRPRGLPLPSTRRVRRRLAVRVLQDGPSQVPHRNRSELQVRRSMTPNSIQLDRADGAVVASAAGDALGSQYEFGPAHPDSFVPQFGRGCFGHDAGEWTDDTSMGIPLLDALTRGKDLLDPAVQAEIVRTWIEWSRTAK